MLREGRIAKAAKPSSKPQEPFSLKEFLCDWNTLSSVMLAAALAFLLYMTVGPGLGGQKQVLVVRKAENIGGFTMAARLIPLTESTVTLWNGDVIATIDAKPHFSANKVDLLFLPDSKLTLENLKSTHMLQVYAQHGYRAVAVDLPGTGARQSLQTKAPKKKKIEKWMDSLIAALELSDTVIVAMGSGSAYALPVLYDSNKWQGLRGMVLVSPHKANVKNSEALLKTLKLPLLYIHGALDDPTLAATNKRFLQNVPDFRYVIVSNAGQFPHEIQFSRFNTELLAFLVQSCSLPPVATAPNKDANGDTADSGYEQVPRDDDYAYDADGDGYDQLDDYFKDWGWNSEDANKYDFDDYYYYGSDDDGNLGDDSAEDSY